MSRRPVCGPRFVDLCAGAGGMALGLERAGLVPALLVENDHDACRTLAENRPEWKVLEQDLQAFDVGEHPEAYGVDLLAAGLPRLRGTAAVGRCDDSRQLELLRTAALLVSQIRPRAVVIENVPGLLVESRFAEIREYVFRELRACGYDVVHRVVDAQEFGVPQTRKHGVMVAMHPRAIGRFRWPESSPTPPPTVGEVLRESMAENGWLGADDWAEAADGIAPTIVGGSKVHGGADLGPTGSKNAWARMGVNGGSLGDSAPGPDFVIRFGQGKYGRDGLVRLTVAQVALLQGFPGDWRFVGRKTRTYRQVAQALPPAIAAALGRSVIEALREA